MARSPRIDPDEWREDSYAEPEYDEVTLADIVQTLTRRKVVLGATFLVVVLSGLVYTALQTPQYESSASLVPLEHPDIIKNWLDSRQAAQLVVGNLGSRIESALFPDRWDASRGTWSGAPPTAEQFGRQLQEHVQVNQRTARVGTAQERFLEVVVSFPDPTLARDVAREYIRTLDTLRPNLENITRQEAFDEYYDGQNEVDAQRQAEVTARQKQYWIALDSASLPEEPSSPNVVLNVSLSVVLGLFLSIFMVFFWEWLSRYRAEVAELNVPESPGEEPPAAKHTEGPGPRLLP